MALIIGTSISRSDYYFDLSKFKKIDPDVGGGVSILAIKADGSAWVPLEYKPIHEILFKK